MVIFKAATRLTPHSPPPRGQALAFSPWRGEKTVEVAALDRAGEKLE
jgi:hypothetical protein